MFCQKSGFFTQYPSLINEKVILFFEQFGGSLEKKDILDNTVYYNLFINYPKYKHL